MAVQSVAIWPELGSMYVHEGHETSGGEPQTIGDPANPVPRRYAYPESVQGETSGTSSLSYETTDFAGVPGEPQEECAIANQENRISGIPMSMRLSLPKPKVHSIVQLSRRMAYRDKVSLRELVRAIGTMVAAQPAILPAPLHYRFLESAPGYLLLFTNMFVVDVNSID